MLVLWGRGPLHWLNHICFSKDAPAGCRGVGFGISDSSLHWRCRVSLWSLTVLMGDRGWWKMALPHPLMPGRGELSSAIVQEALKEKQSPLWPSLCQIPALILSILAMDISGTTVLLCFISGTHLGFKTQNLKGHSKAQTCCPLEKSLIALHWGPLWPRKVVAWLWR